MKTNINNSTTVISRWTRFLGVSLCAGLALALMVSTVAVSQYANPAVVPLGKAGTFGALAGSAITGSATINGDIGAISAIDVTIHTNGGTIYPVNDQYVRDAQTDLAAALNSANRGADVTDATGVISGTLTPGVYRYTGATVNLSAPIILNGGAVSDARFIIQTDATLNVSSTVTLAGTAVWSNVFWYVGSSATINNGSTFKGIILANTAITLNSGVTVPGARLLAHTAAVTVNSTVLPVELVSFTATANRMPAGGGFNADLKWSTATEVNNYGFEVERRQTADWAKVGFVQGAGTSNAPRDYSYTDNNLSPGRYTYRLKQVDRDGAFSYHGSVEVEIGSAPQAFALLQNYPNPFNPSTVISYQLPVNSQVTLKVYDLLGLEVATLVNGRQEAGSYTVPFSAIGGSTLASGVYIYRLKAGSFVSTKKLVLMK